MMNITQTFKSFLLPFFVLFFAVTFSQNINSVTQYPLSTSLHECHATTVTATLDVNLLMGQAVYLRYSNDDYTSSTVIKMTGSDKTYTAKIPSAFNGAGVNASYYVFRATDSGIDPDGTNADLSAVTVNDNGGDFYTYVVAAGGGATYVPDDNFEQALIDLGLDCDLDDYVFTSNIIDVTALDVTNKSISTLEGIKGFTNLEMLQCQNKGDVGNDNVLEALDVSGMTKLKYLYCQDNQIENLDITGVANLWELNTSNNPLSGNTLDLAGSPDIYYLACENNGFTSLDVSGLTNLDTLVIWDNQISTLDLSNNPKVKYLDCDDNLFTDLNVSGLLMLEQFYCSGNDLASLDLRGLSNLTDFIAENNSLLTCILVDDIIAAGSALNWVKGDTAFYSYCDCNKTTTWTAASGGSWDNGAPTDGTYAAIISADYNESANINACSLTIKNNAIVLIPEGYNVSLNAPMLVEAASSFTLSNNANLIQTNTKSINSGGINVIRNSNPLYRSDYTLWSSPVADQNLLTFSPETISSRFYSYNSASNYYNTISSPSTTNFAIGESYLIRMPNTAPEANYDNGSATLVYQGVFSGVPNNGNVSLTGLDANAYHAVGNPYPSIINADAFLDANSTDGVLYFWRKTNEVSNSGSAYASYTAMGGTAASNVAPNNIKPNGKIQVGQGFIVKTGTSTTALNFTNAMRELTSTTASFFKTKKTSERSRIWLNLTSTTGVFSQALIGYMDGATIGVDARIDGKYINDSQVALTSNINGEEYSIQGRPAFDPADEVILNFKAVVGGVYTIAIDHVEGVFTNGQDVYLVDSKTGVETDLSTDSYTFTADSGIDNSRFSLKYQKTLSVNSAVFNENSVSVYKNNGTLYVTSGVSTINSIKVFDIQGRLVAEQNNVKSNTATIKNLKAKQQVLIVQVTSDDNKVVSKKVVD